jgi:hypothetical protein
MPLALEMPAPVTMRRGPSEARIASARRSMELVIARR